MIRTPLASGLVTLAALVVAGAPAVGFAQGAPGAAPAGSAASSAPAAKPRPAARKAPLVDPASVEPTADAPTADAKGAAKGSTRAAGAKADAKPGKGGRAMDRLELDTTQITGNRELPKVMVVVPWKKSDIGDLVGKPINSLVDEALEPVDREVFRREVDYYGALAPDRPAAAPATRSETGVTPGAATAPAEK